MSYVRPRLVAAVAAALAVVLLVLVVPNTGTGPFGPTPSPSADPDGGAGITGVESNPGVVVIGTDAEGARIAEIIVAVRNVGDTTVLLDPLRSAYELTDATGAIVGEGRFGFAGPTLIGPGERGYLIGWATVRGTPTGGAARNVAFTESEQTNEVRATGTTIGRDPLSVTTTLSAQGIALALCYATDGTFVGAVGSEGTGRLTLGVPRFVPTSAAARCELFAGPAPER
jgi:hypothetical protein